MNSYLLDTSVIIDYHKNKKETLDLVDNIEGELTSSYVCLAELYEGIHRVKDSTSAEKAVLNFFSSLTHVFGVDFEIAKKFGKIRMDLRTKGQFIGDMDIFIAATCIAHNQILITYNKKHFLRISELKIL